MLESTWVQSSHRSGSPPNFVIPQQGHRTVLRCFRQLATFTAHVLVTIARSFSWACVGNFQATILFSKVYYWVIKISFETQQTTGNESGHIIFFYSPCFKVTKWEEVEIYLISEFCCNCLRVFLLKAQSWCISLEGHRLDPQLILIGITKLMKLE